ncbi:unnamed protein product, partial [Rotaria sordida]
MAFDQKINDKFQNLFSTPIPTMLQQRALYEKQLIQSIRYTLKEDNLILRRTADHMNIFYLGNRQNFEAKANEYLTKTDAYTVIIAMDGENDNQQQQLQNELNEMIESINFALKVLKSRKAIDDNITSRLLLHATNIKIPSLYFLPDVSKEDEMELLPFIISQHSVTSKIGKYLNRLLRPFADNIMKSTTFRHEADLIKKLNHYASMEHRLNSTTLFCTIKILNFNVLDIHKNMIDTVAYVLQDHPQTTNILKHISINTIKNLLQLFLYNNIFYYNDKIYTFTKGSPNAMPLTDTLSNIYIFEWQKLILKNIKQNELFG